MRVIRDFAKYLAKSKVMDLNIKFVQFIHHLRYNLISGSIYIWNPWWDKYYNGLVN